MAKYRIIAPDGRKFMITGEEIPPTQEQVRALITNYQEPSIKAQAASISKLHQGLRPLTEEEKERAKALAKEIRPKKTYGDYLVNNLADIAFGAKKALSGATFGASDWLGRKMGVDMSDQSYLSARDAENLGTAARTAGFVSEIGGNMLGAGGGLLKTLGKTGLKGLKLATAAGGIEGGIYGLTGSDTLKDVPIKMSVGSALGALLPVGIHGVGYGTKWAARPLTDKVTHYLGKRKLAKQLAKGADFDDVNLGNVDDELATRLNQVRNAENVSPVDSARVGIPKDSVEHVYQRRISDDKYTPDDMAEVVDNALFGKNIQVGKGNLPQYQIIYDSSNPANKVVVGKHRDTGDIFVKTSLKDSGLSKKNKTLDGRTFPSFAVDNTVTGNSSIPSPQHVRFSDFQDLNASIIAPNTKKVNPAFQRSFVEALADENKRRIMKDAVKSGAEDLSERAKILADRLERRNNGMIDPDFEEVIKTPELRLAEKKYSGFMRKNGNQLMSENKIIDFYRRHPIAQDMISEMRSVDPRAFDSIRPGSLSEFDMLKRTLREEAGNKVKVGASRSGALKRAENELKELMDSEFSGFRDVNRNFANAQTTQDIFESKLKKGLTSVGGATASPFWSGISSPLTAAGVVGGYFNPLSLAITAGGLGGKAIMRNIRRNSGRRLADGIIRTPIDVNINPNFAAALSATTFNNLKNR